MTTTSDQDQEARRREMEMDRYLADFVDLGTSWYRGWYLERRVEEEMLRSARHGHSFALIGLQVSGAGRQGSDERDSFLEVLRNIPDTALRQTDFPAVMSDNRYAVLLPETDREGGERVGRRIRRQLNSYDPRLVLAVYPDDSNTLHGLMQAIEPKASKVVNIMDYRSR
jgi:GGDEF domain-containing protein